MDENERRSSDRDDEQKQKTAFVEVPEEANKFEPSPDTVRIAAVEAAVVAGVVGHRTQPLTPSTIYAPDDPIVEPVQSFELPDWTDPPTGQVPRVVLDDEGVEAGHEEALIPGPRWREDASDWDDTAGHFALLAEDPDRREDTMAGSEQALAASRDPYGLEQVDAALAGELPQFDEAPWAPLFEEIHTDGPESNDARLESDGPELGQFPDSRQRRARLHAKTTTKAAPVRRRAGLSVATGIGLGAVVVGCAFSGSVALLALVAVVVGIAAGEIFAVLRKAGYVPATPIGLIAVVGTVVAAYFYGPQAVAIGVAASFLAVACAVLFGVGRAEPIGNFASTILVIIWVGALASFASLLLAPSAFPHRHGVAIVIGILICVAGHDVGSYLIGAKFGRHKIAPNISPSKSVEGLIGGTVLTLILAVAVVSQIHPLNLADALGLGVVTSVFGPLGDFTESLVKRDLGAKDMGRLLPAHGGVFDRIDAMLFVLPASYVFVRLVHL